MFASAFRFDTSRLHAAFAPRKPRNPLLRLLAGLLGVVVLAAMLVVGLFVGTAMLLAGLGMPRRYLQAVAKAKGLPWDIGKSFDFAAPASTLLRAADVGALSDRTLSLEVDGTTRQSSTLDHMVWSVPEILHELSKLYALRAGDLVFMGTPAGVGPLLPGNTFRATLDDLLELQGTITG